MPRGLLRLFLLNILLFVSLCAVDAVGTELILPDNVFFFQPVASAYGQNPIWINPAMINTRQAGTIFGFTHRGGDFIADWGGGTTVKNIGIAYRKLNNDDSDDVDEWVIALGGGNRVAIGLSYRYFRSGPGYLNNRHLWNLGMMTRSNRNVSVGARFENLNRGEIGGEDSDIRFVYGVATRPYRDLVTVTFDVDMTQRESLRLADFRTGIEVRPYPGVFVFGDFDNHSRINLGFRINLGQSYAGHYHNFDRNFKGRMGTTFIGRVNGSQPSLIKPGRKTLNISLDGNLPENKEIPIFGRKPLVFFDYVKGIYRAADDDAVGSIYLQIGNLGCGMARAEELAAALRYFKGKGKKVFAHLENANNIGYLVASEADEIAVPLVSEFGMIGLHAELRTYKGLMDKLGVEAEIERIDQYKSAPEPFIFEKPSEPYREQVNSLLDDLYEQFCTPIAANRGMAQDQVHEIIDRCPMSSKSAQESGLVDDLLYQDEAKEKFAPDAWSFYDYVKGSVYDDSWIAPPRIALIIAEGGIAPGKSGGKIGAFEMLDAIRAARRDTRVLGVLLRVNSPGGFAVAADRIWHELEKVSREKPVVISMGNLAASGGYYISCIDGEVFVDRASIVGSIGVFSGKLNLSQLFDKIGVYSESYSRGENADMYSLSHPFTEEQRKKLRSRLQEFYQYFIGLVGISRGLAPDSVDMLGRGRVFVGARAVDNGLADQLGGIYRAFEELCRRCGTDPEATEVKNYPEKSYLFENPFDLPVIYNKLAQAFSHESESLELFDAFESGNIFYRLPYLLTIE